MAHGVVKSQVEAPLTLDEAPPRALGLLDQGALWGNLGVSLLGFSGAVALVDPLGDRPLSFAAAMVAAVVGSLVGTAMVGLAAVPGTQTGAPAMVLLRGLFGARLSYLPTVLNVIQMLGWGAFELWVIAQGAQAIAGSMGARVPYEVWVVLAGVVTTALTIKPLGAVRLLRRYVTVGVIVAMGYFTYEFVGRAPELGGGSWEAFAPAVDYVIALSVSWVPLAADFSRFSRSSRAAFGGVVGGYTVAQVACLALGIGAMALVGNDTAKVWDPFVSASLGAVFFGILVLRESDQSFVNVYSTTMSIQNLLPRVDRRIISVATGVFVTLLAIFVSADTYAAFLGIIGAVFVPMFAVLVVDYFVLGGAARWDVSATAPSRWPMVVPWALGFVTWWLLGALPPVAWWESWWLSVRDWLGFTPAPWMSAALGSFLVAALITLALPRRRR
ncbi:purine-cytosine permease family protein [Acrocarpospora catenulata]|uniref:purine-cytosine permease family protein n=1 Tax=Acrocarpospora catenulata TaxID=2836182 RepID=UPI001BDAF853|nr:cytosine permease [Acrocarpospora catenulata]